MYHPSDRMLLNSLFRRSRVLPAAPRFLVSGSRATSVLRPLHVSAARHLTRAERAKQQADLAQGVTANQSFSHVQRLFEQVQNATKEMVESNEGFSVQRSSGGAGLAIATGQPNKTFTFSYDPATDLLCFMTPKTGNFHYYRYDVPTAQWVDTTNAHFLLELLTRDLIYYCKGFPKF
jgi:hypothetical protein